MADIKVLIVDDEALARKRSRRLVEAVGGFEVIGELRDGAELARFCRENTVEIVLLDIEMGELSGLDAMRLMDGEGPQVVFITAHSEHAVAAFDAGATDYVLKPVEAGRLKLALQRTEKRLEGRKDTSFDSLDSSEEIEQPADRIAVPTRRGLMILQPEEISYALVDGASTIIHSTRGTLVTDFRIVALERKLSGHGFVRVHRRVLVNLAHIRTLERMGSSYVAETSDGAQIPVSRQAAKELKARWRID